MILGLLAVSATAGVLGHRGLAKARMRSLVVSCNNHQRFLWMALIQFGADTHGALPYEPGVPGYTMLKNFSSRPRGGVNCHHGAPGSLIGGWQAVNLPSNIWLSIVGKWPASLGGKPIPFAWCGKPTGTGQRVVTTIIAHSPDYGFSLHHGNIQEIELKNSLSELNRLLEPLGVPPVALDVPDGVAWTETNCQNKMEPQQTPAGDRLKAPPE